MKKKTVTKKSSKKVSKKSNMPTIDVTELERVYGGRIFRIDGTKGGIYRV